MSGRLDHVLRHERLCWSSLIVDDVDLPDLFNDLCRRSEPHVQAGRIFIPRYEADSAFNPASDRSYHGLPSDLAAEWTAYRDRWAAFMAANPRCRLASIISWISETHDFSSWPYGREDEIRDWVRAGLFDLPPFDDRIGIVTAEWKRGLAATVAA